MEQQLAINRSLQELMQQRSGELDRFENALKAPKIIQATVEEIKQVLRFSMILVGVRGATMNAMSEEEKIILIEFLREKYPTHTIAEIKLAFTKAAAHELDITEVNHYENFTCEYVGRVMSAYRKWASTQNMALRQKLEREEYLENERLLAKKEYTDEEIINNHLQHWERSINRHVEYINPDCFDILFKHGILKLEDDKIQETIQHAKTIIFLSDVPKNKKDAQMKDDDYIEMLCKKITVQQYFNELLEHGVTQLCLTGNRDTDDF